MDFMMNLAHMVMLNFIKFNYGQIQKYISKFQELY